MRNYVLAAILLAGACSPGGAATRAFPVAGFDRIASSGSWTVRVHTGSAPSVHASGDAAQLDRLEIAVHDGELRIGSKSGLGGWFGTHGPVTIDVTVPNLRAASLSGSGELAVDRVRAPTFGGSLTGSGHLRIAEIEAGQVALQLTGSGELTIAGRAASAAINATGSGNLQAGGLKVQDATIRTVGSGDVSAAAARTATISLMGSGDVAIAGSPRCTVAKHGSGSVRCG